MCYALPCGVGVAAAELAEAAASGLVALPRRRHGEATAVAAAAAEASGLVMAMIAVGHPLNLLPAKPGESGSGMPWQADIQNSQEALAPE